MLDIRLIREKPEEVRQALLKRMDQVDFQELLGWDRERRSMIAEIDSFREKRNSTASRIGDMKRGEEDTTDLQAQMKDLSRRIKELEASLEETEMRIQSALEALPNMPDSDVPAGGKKCNQVLTVWGAEPKFDFKPRDHVELATRLGLIDYERGVKLGGRGYWLYHGDGARIEWALLNYFVESHLSDGYEFVLPPHILTYQCGYTAGQFPKFADDVFHLKSEESFLLPTTETAIINLHRDEILAEQELPKRYFAYTPCYRREAGSYRTEERGTVRGHQFNKVEMFAFTRPEESDAAFEELVGKAEKLVQGLGLHHRVSKLAAGDTSAAMAKTYDIEVWLPSMREFKEVSSASNARDYQARRGSIRFRRGSTGRPEYLHTLNASGLATSRLLPAILEQNQRADGTVAVPQVLQKSVGKQILG
ncbi:MAG TPA: serine--tRNA ligase [Candidatus Binatia bacterium]|nr:serine--tRNA ligase [Candidatus Binatia bacterium]